MRIPRGRGCGGGFARPQQDPLHRAVHFFKLQNTQKVGLEGLGGKTGLEDVLSKHSKHLYLFSVFSG